MGFNEELFGSDRFSDGSSVTRKADSFQNKDTRSCFKSAHPVRAVTFSLSSCFYDDSAAEKHQRRSTRTKTNDADDDQPGASVQTLRMFGCPKWIRCSFDALSV